MSKKIIFMGTSVFAVKILKSLYQNGYPIATVYTQAPKKSNRGMRVTKSPVHSISETLSLEVRTPVTLKNNQEEYEYLKDIDADMCDDILDDKAKFKDQDHSKATYAKKINKKESSIDWNTPAKSVIAKINGLNGAHFIFQGARYKILKAELNNLSGKPGEIIGDSLEIACKEKSIKVMMIQREGKKPQKTAEFLLGSQIKKGLFLSNV